MLFLVVCRPWCVERATSIFSMLSSSLIINWVHISIYFLDYIASITNHKVIDDEKKTQELEANKDGPNNAKNNKGAAWDAPYPEGVKKHKIRIPEAPQGKSSTVEEDVKANGTYMTYPQF